MKNKAFIVTGCSGIAAATIKLLLEAGAQVMFIGISSEQCKAFSAQLSDLGLHADYQVGDLTQPTTAVDFVATAYNKYKRLDGLYNVAGISGRKYGDGPLHECTEQGWSKVMETNLTTQYRMCREVISLMIDQDPDENGHRGVILNMSSILGIDPEPENFNAIAYATSKGAVISMTKSIAAYYAKYQIRANSIAPGLVRTGMSARASEDKNIIEFIKHKQPLKGDVMTADEIGEVSFFLLSDQAKMITGQTLIVDAGWKLV